MLRYKVAADVIISLDITRRSFNPSLSPWVLVIVEEKINALMFLTYKRRSLKQIPAIIRDRIPSIILLTECKSVATVLKQ